MQAVGWSQRRFVMYAIIIAVVASLTASGIAVAYHITKPSETIMQGVYVAGLHVGQLTPEQARRYVGQYVQSVIDLPITIRVDEEAWDVTSHDLGISPRIDEMIDYAYAVGRRGAFWNQMADRFRVVRRGVAIPVLVDVDRATFERWLDRLASEYERPPRDARLEVNNQRVDIIPSIHGLRLERHGVYERVRTVAGRLNHRTVRISFTEIAPQRSTADVRALGISHHMGSYTTYFDPSDHNRTENIRIAARALDGLILAPGEELSFNRRVGPRIESEGYREAPVIIDGELVPDIGGGVCQVSSTLYNAVLHAGLRVSHRAAHSIPSTYVPLGFDAAVAYDFLDFRFKNDQETHVLLRATVGHDDITLSFYGKAPDYESVRLESEVVEIFQPRVVENVTTSLAPGERRIVQEGRRGYRVHVWRVTERGGQTERTLISRSFYRSRDQIVSVGASEK